MAIVGILQEEYLEQTNEKVKLESEITRLQMELQKHRTNQAEFETRILVGIDPDRTIELLDDLEL